MNSDKVQPMLRNAETFRGKANRREIIRFFIFTQRFVQCLLALINLDRELGEQTMEVGFTN